MLEVMENRKQQKRKRLVGLWLLAVNKQVIRGNKNYMVNYNRNDKNKRVLRMG